MTGPSWLNDPALADELRERGHHYDLWELAEANGRLREMGSFSNYEAESRFVRPEDLIDYGRAKGQEPLEVQIETMCIKIEEEQLPAFRGPGTELKAIVYTDKIKKGIVLNQQMVGVLKQLTGDRTEAVPGIRIGLYLIASNRSGSGYALQIRPGIPAPSASAPPPPPPAPSPAAESIPRPDRSIGDVPDDEIPF